MKRKRRWFGPSKAEIWKQFSEGIGGEFYVEKNRMSKIEKVYAYHKEWEICLDTFVVSSGKSHVTYTRFRAAYVFRDNFTFRIVRRNFFRDIGKRFGMEDLEVGHAQFDHDFIIQGTDQRKCEMLFENPRLRELISGRQKHIEIKIEDGEGVFKNDYPDGINVLNFTALGVIKDLDRLYEIYDLFAEILDQLYEIGTADEDEPNFGF